MIVKKIKNPKKSSSKQNRIFALLDYIATPHAENRAEKCQLLQAINFISDDYNAAKNEMLALSLSNSRSKDTINHYILSWPADEIPTDLQIHEAVDIFLSELGMQNHQTIFALHADTNNLHCHIVINRVDPITQKVTEIGHRGFDIELIHKAVAKIEYLQGWKPNENALYSISPDATLERRPQSETKTVSSEKKQKEIATGVKSAEQTAIDYAAPIIKKARSWAELHEKLAKVGMTYEKKGSGAIIVVDNIAVKASKVDRTASLSKLEKKFGTFEENTHTAPIQSFAPSLTNEAVNDQIFDLYSTEQMYITEQINRIKRNAEKKYLDELNALKEMQRKEREDLINIEKISDMNIRNAISAALAQEHSEERRQLKRDYKAQLQAELQFQQLDQTYSTNYKQWINAIKTNTSQNLYITNANGKDYEESLMQTQDIPSYTSRAYRNYVEYFHDNTLAFLEFENVIKITDTSLEKNILTALLLGKQKFGELLIVGGTKSHIDLMIRFAIEYDVKIANPELQESIIAEKGRIETQTPSP